jgi:hypothetical protein
VRISPQGDLWTYTVITAAGRRLRSPLGFRESTDAMTAGRSDALAYEAADRRLSC